MSEDVSAVWLHVSSSSSGDVLPVYLGPSQVFDSVFQLLTAGKLASLRVMDSSSQITWQHSSSLFFPLESDGWLSMQDMFPTWEKHSSCCLWSQLFTSEFMFPSDLANPLKSKLCWSSCLSGKLSLSVPHRFLYTCLTLHFPLSSSVVSQRFHVQCCVVRQVKLHGAETRLCIHKKKKMMIYWFLQTSLLWWNLCSSSRRRINVWAAA